MGEGPHLSLKGIACTRVASNVRTVRLNCRGCGRKLWLLIEDSILEFFSGFDNNHGKLKSMQSAFKLRIKPAISGTKTRNYDDSKCGLTGKVIINMLHIK
jgi:hypothetical protein